jgi:hypothetical protein
MRNIVEHSPGHDTMFYNTMSASLQQNGDVASVFGDQSSYYRHALVEKAHYCHGIFAVGDPVVDELRFLGPRFKTLPIDLVYNGLPAVDIGEDERMAAWGRLRSYSMALSGSLPDFVLHTSHDLL